MRISHLDIWTRARLFLLAAAACFGLFLSGDETLTGNVTGNAIESESGLPLIGTLLLLLVLALVIIEVLWVRRRRPQEEQIRVA